MRTQLFLALALTVAAPAYAATDWKQVEQIFGRPAAEQPGGVHRFSLPRSDLKVTLDGVAIKPALALGSWLAFRRHGRRGHGHGRPGAHRGRGEPGHEQPRRGRHRDHRPAQPPAARQPATMYMHVEGHGDPVKLAQALRLRSSKAKRRGAPAGAAAAQKKSRRSTPLPSSAFSAARAKRAAASISSRSRAPRRSRPAAWKCRLRWAPPSPSTFSRPASGKAAIGRRLRADRQ